MEEFMQYKGSYYRPLGFIRNAMAVVLRRVGHHNWGWFSREHQRMHLQTVDPKSIPKKKAAHVWLENLGTRRFDPEPEDRGKVTTDELKSLEAKAYENREDIEIRWTSWVIQKGWLKATLRDHFVDLDMYEKHNTVSRTVDLHDHLAPEIAAKLTQQDITFDHEIAMLVLWPRGATFHIYLVPVLWHGTPNRQF
jgi:hypothetical protein